MAHNDTIVLSMTKPAPAANNSRNWSRYNVLLTGILLVVVLLLDSLVINYILRFVGETYTKEFSGSSNIVCAYIGILLVALVFQFVLAIDADRRKNTMQVAALGVFNLVCAGISFVQLYQVDKLKSCSVFFVDIMQSGDKMDIKLEQLADVSRQCMFNAAKSVEGQYVPVSNSKPLLIVANDISRKLSIFDTVLIFQVIISVFMVIAACIGLFFASKCFVEYGWSVYLTQGADLNKKKMLERYQLFMLFLKLNAYFFLGVLAQYQIATFYFKKTANAEYDNIGLIVGAILTVLGTAVYSGFGYFGARKTNYIIMGIFMILLMINFLGLVVILYRVYVTDMQEYRPTIIWLTTFGMKCLMLAIAQLITNLVTYGFGVLLLMDFKDGLGDLGNILIDIVQSTLYDPQPDKANTNRFVIE